MVIVRRNINTYNSFPQNSVVPQTQPLLPRNLNGPLSLSQRDARNGMIHIIILVRDSKPRAYCLVEIAVLIQRS